VTGDGLGDDTGADGSKVHCSTSRYC